MDLSTKIAGVTLNNCIMNASGARCTTTEELVNLTKSDAGAIVCKSSTFKPREGNPKPRYYEDAHGTINSMGAPNFGYKFYTQFSNSITKPFFQSIIPFSIGELAFMLTDINKDTTRKIFIEINLSCPNIKGKSIVGKDFKTLNEYLTTVNKLNLPNLILGVKMPPYTEPYEFDAVSDIIKKNKCIKFITCINSIYGLIIDSENETTCIHPKSGYGGIGGIYCKPTALLNVNSFYKRLNIDIIGCGGIATGKDLFDHILAGGSLGQIGSCLMKDGSSCFNRILKELCNIMKKKGYKTIDEFKGKLKIIELTDYGY